jgi:hypothetical protein
MARLKAKMLEDIPITKIILRQRTLTDVNGTVDSPHIETIPIQATDDFIVPYVNVLIMEGGIYRQAIPGVDFMVTYISPNEMQVELFFSGNCKINY